MRVRVATDEDRQRFNSFVAASPHGDVLQSWEWGEVKGAGGWHPVRLLVENEGEIAAACSMLLTRPARLIPPIAYAPRGPVFTTERGQAFEKLVAGIREHAGEAFVFTCDPPVLADSADASVLKKAEFRTVSGGGFGGIQPSAVMILDLEPDLDSIFAGFKSKWRYNVRLAERKGVAVREGSREDLPVFYDLLLETAKRDRFFVRGSRYFETLWDCLNPPGMLKVFLAEFEGRAIAGIVLLCMGGRAVYTYGASSNEHRNVMPNHLIQWHAIRWAKNSGYRVYDFRGVSVVRDGQPKEPELSGLNRFKEGFGARYVEHAGQFDLPLRKGWYALWKRAGPPAIALMKKIRPPTND